MVSPDSFAGIRILATCCSIALLGLSAERLNAQMVPGVRAIGESKVLGLDRDHKARDFSIQQIGCNMPGNVLWPGDRPVFKFRVTNLTLAPLSAKGAIQVIHYGTRGKPGDIWEPLFFKIADFEKVPLSVDLAPNASTEITIEPKIPETFGGYVLVAELEGHGRAFAASLVRTLEPDGGAERFPAYALDLNGTSEEVARFFKRIGVKGARAEINVFDKRDKDYDKKWATIEKLSKVLQENEVTLMVTTASGALPMPFDGGRPHLDDADTYMETKRDLAWLPSADGEFQSWVQKLCGTYGWPKGPINAIELWNEPWEGISISGWGADMLRYREIYTAMALGVEAARKADGTDVLMGGTGSSSNTVDKFFSDGSDTFLKWLDFCSIHYQAMAATPALMRDFINRKSPYGPVRVWDTESWIANSEDRVGLVVASMHAMGQERAMGVYAGNVYEPQSVTLEGGKKETVVQTWSSAAAVAASTKFVGQRVFRELLFQNGLPWVFVFEGRPGKSEDDGTVVVSGDLGGSYSRNLLLFRTVHGLKNQKAVRDAKERIAMLPANAPDAERKALQTQLEAASVLDGGSMKISDGGGKFMLMDFYGNRVPAENGVITVPLDGNGYYLRTNGEGGSFAKLLNELRKGQVAGYEPVEIIPHDLTERVTAANPKLRLTLTNVLNRPVTGKLGVRMNKRDLLETPLSVILKPHETREVEVGVSGVKTVAENVYPLRVEFDAGNDGSVVREESIHVNVISNRAITVDGNLDDWTDVVPQTLGAAGIGANLTEKAWLPFTKFDESVAQGLATGYLAYDAENFYFAARISDSTPDDGMVRFETRDDDQYFYPEVAFRYDESATTVKLDKVVSNPILNREFLELPRATGGTGEGGENERSKTVWESLSTSFAVDVNLPKNEQRQVALYLLSGDPLGRHNVSIEIINSDNGKVINRQVVNKFGDGKYAIYHLSGNLRIRVSSNNWLKGVTSGIFFDAPKVTKSVDGASGDFVGTDERTRGNWKGTYGADGYLIAGADEKIPAYAKVAFSSEIKKIELKWPEGVRRYSYRKRPDLPGGGAGSHDNVQIAFNVLPADQKPWLESPAGTPPRWMSYWDTDYEYGLNEVAPQYGGGTEIWRLQVPGMPRKHFYPRQPKSAFDGAVKNGKLVMRRDGNTRIVEASLPWSELPKVKERLDAGERIKFTFRVNDNKGPSYELATERSVSKVNSITFHNDWQSHWSNELEFGFEKTPAAEQQSQGQ